MLVTLTINGIRCTWTCTPGQTLAQALREHGFTSIKCGCEQGACGMCTVWADGKAVLSCSLLLCRLEGYTITTLEGVQAEAAVLADYLLEEGGDQCGFCAPGYSMTVLAMEREGSAPFSMAAIRRYLAGNLCRCSGYRSKLQAAYRYLNRGVLPDAAP